MKIKAAYDKVFERVFGTLDRGEYWFVNIILMIVIVWTVLDSYQYLSAGNIVEFIYNLMVSIVCPITVGWYLGYIAAMNDEEK